MREAVAHACRIRLRPILMTSLATVVGLLPMAFKLETGSEAYAPLARVIIGGLLVSVVLTIFVVPAAYLLIYQRRADAQAPLAVQEAQSADGFVAAVWLYWYLHLRLRLEPKCRKPGRPRSLLKPHKVRRLRRFLREQQGRSRLTSTTLSRLRFRISFPDSGGRKSGECRSGTGHAD